jgi:quinol monooxygenase YgiN
MTARLSIHPGKIDEFRKRAADCMRATRAKDSGTLRYDWFLNDDQTECVVVEAYRDSEAVLDHLANLGPTFNALLEVSDLDIEVYGSPSPELLEAGASLAPRIYSSLLQGL